MSAADDYVGTVRRNGRQVTLEEVHVPPHDPSNPGPEEPVVTECPGVYALDKSGDTFETRTGLVARVPCFVVAALDPALPPGGVSAVSRVRDGDGTVTEVTRLRKRRIRGELIALVLETAG